MAGGVHGRIGGSVFGYDLHADFDGRQITGRMTGRLGGGVIGHDVDVQVEGVPWLVAAALA